jgi:hypothetical protein
MFAMDQARAAADLGRVCRSDGRPTLATWVPEGAVAEFFGVTITEITTLIVAITGLIACRKWNQQPDFTHPPAPRT